MAISFMTALDKAALQLYHYVAIVIAGMGLFTDAYSLFSIVPVTYLIGRIYYNPDDGKPGTVPIALRAAVVASALAGTVIGQLLFGFLGDRLGRKKVFGTTLLIIVLSSFNCGFSIGRTANYVIVSLCFFRFFLGVGIGGDYPLSAIIMSEFANTERRGALVAGVFSMQGFGILFSALVTMIICHVFEVVQPSGKDPIFPHPPPSADLAWRLILMIGTIPAVLTFYSRMAMPETPRYTALVEGDMERAIVEARRVLEIDTDLLSDVEDHGANMMPPPDQYSFFSKKFFKRHGSDLAACAISWFLLDVVFYSTTLFQSWIYKSVLKPPEHVNVFTEAFNLAKFQAVFSIAAIIPGYFAAIMTIDRVGRREIQMIGFLIMAIVLFCMVLSYNAMVENNRIHFPYLIMYALIFFFANFGPNTTTFVLPAELFPARFRTTCHGIAGAAGKVGAIIGSIGLLWSSETGLDDQNDRVPGSGMKYILIGLTAICFVGVVHTFSFTPRSTVAVPLEEHED
ncbi:phosphate transporter 1 [Rhynchospora pubera]|uniref:H(+)/Pi cotransporter n=1 Tax=Rhynchospora pubera TaxID=906938 RepID=A0AAV8FR89_9POAL|nr:phosphate transporter 1 [Rhynchospora pubera]